jgi:outer membrane protease
VGEIVTVKSILAASVWLVVAVAASLLGAAPASAGNWTFHGLEPPSNYTGEAGLRFWYGKAKTGKNLYDSTGSFLISRLTYDNLSILSAEAYGRFDLNTGWFLKGLVGGGGFRKGTLTDEDFPPGISPYSATLSVLDESFPLYASVDGGYNLFRGPDFRVGAFVGYNYMREVVSAQGCGQIATNPFICGVFTIPATIKVITQDNNWGSLRVGLNGEVDITKQLRLSVDAAWLPMVWLNGTDAHWLRISAFPGDFSGPIPEDGTGWGYQLEGVLSYRVTDSISVGVGGRYWHMQTNGLTHFEGHINGFSALPQPVDWRTDNYGVFLQTGLKFGPYPIISSN